MDKMKVEEGLIKIRKRKIDKNKEEDEWIKLR